MKKSFYAFCLILVISLTSSAQILHPLNIGHTLRGHIYVKSSIVDSNALSGFSRSDNLPKKVDQSLNFKVRGLFLLIDTTESSVIDNKYISYKLYIVNESDSIIELAASDSRLPAIAEVFINGQWRPIEYLPSSGCGNSYHKVYLGQNEYWEFEIPKFAGKLSTKMRYSLNIGRNEFIYSNEIQVNINKGQLRIKEGYNSNGIVDPYN